MTVYNFQVDADHTYFVSAGGAWVWVHNGPCPTKILGGLYKDVRAANIGGEVHHMPSFAAVQEGLWVNAPKLENLPAIWMTEADHALTASFRGSDKAIFWRELQIDLLEEGKIKEAIELDILDVRSRFGSKYDTGIKQMLAVLDTSVRPKIFF